MKKKHSHPYLLTKMDHPVLEIILNEAFVTFVPYLPFLVKIRASCKHLMVKVSNMRNFEYDVLTENGVFFLSYKRKEEFMAPEASFFDCYYFRKMLLWFRKFIADQRINIQQDSKYDLYDITNLKFKRNVLEPSIIFKRDTIKIWNERKGKYSESVIGGVDDFFSLYEDQRMFKCCHKRLIISEPEKLKRLMRDAEMLRPLLL